MHRLLFLLFLLAPCAYGDDSFPNELNVLRGTILLQFLIDRGQTGKIRDAPNSYESMPLLGENPSNKRMNIYFSVAGLVVIGASYLIPKKYRKTFLYGVNGVQFSYVSHNYASGHGAEIKIKF